MFGGGTHSAAGVALLRTGGIVTGVLLFMFLTVIILPKSATIEALRWGAVSQSVGVLLTGGGSTWGSGVVCRRELKLGGCDANLGSGPYLCSTSHPIY